MNIYMPAVEVPQYSSSPISICQDNFHLEMKTLKKPTPFAFPSFHILHILCE